MRIMEDIALQNNINPPNMDGYMLQKKFEIMIDINNKKMTNELSKINNVLSSLNEEICRIKKQISGNSQVVKAQSVAPEIQVEKNNAESVQNVNKPKDNWPASRPRYGDYKSDDVSINKFFYFGNK